MADDGSSRENIVLVGFMGSGKSSIGRSISKKLGFQFVDTDQIVIERSGRSIARIFEEEGEAAFPNGNIRAQSHIQIAVRDLSCISPKVYLIPRRGNR